MATNHNESQKPNDYVHGGGVGGEDHHLYHRELISNVYDEF